MLHWLGKWILRLGRWEIANLPPDIPQMIIIGGPHTSNWDFVYALSLRYAVKLELRYLIKQEWMDTPLKRFFHATGGYGVNRSKKENMVDFAADIFSKEPNFVLALSPEGTRAKVEKLRSGFYHIAHKAKVPLVLFALDYGKREFRFSEPFFTTDDKAADMAYIVDWFGKVAGKNPDLGIGWSPTTD